MSKATWPKGATIALGKRYRCLEDGHEWTIFAADFESNCVQLERANWSNVSWSGTYQEFADQFTEFIAQPAPQEAQP